jgi:hypothetical protein
MKRFFLILFVLMLPLQASWAAVVPYSQHESFGYHAERCSHAASVASDPSESRSDGGSDPSTPHGDCTLCHLGHCGVANGDVRPLALTAASLRAPSSADPNLSAFSIPPDRPKWPLHA